MESKEKRKERPNCNRLLDPETELVFARAEGEKLGRLVKEVKTPRSTYW